MAEGASFAINGVVLVMPDPRDGKGNTASEKIVSRETSVAMDVYDSLPLVVRQALQDAALSFDTIGVAELLTQGNSPVAIAHAIRHDKPPSK